VFSLVIAAGGNFMIVDFEHHYIPIELARRMGINTETRTIVEEDGVAKANVHAQLFDLDAQIQDMDRAGIDVAVQTCILGWDTTLENCRLLNDCAATIQKEYPGRFVGLAHIPPLEGEPALKELERAVGDLQLKGVTISSQVRGLSLDADGFRPFYDAVTRLQIPIFVHPALAPKGYELLKDYQLSVILTREFDLGVAVTRLIAGNVLERYPGLSFVISHFGGGLAGYKERIARSSYRFKLPKSFGDYFDRLYFDMAGFEGSPIALRCALEGIRPERMVFATDYPQNFNNNDPKIGKNVDGIREYIEEIENLPLDTSIKNDMLGGTAARLLKLGV
jgi:predicted TIM-barrel fold metal-dependent hydrolase